MSPYVTMPDQAFNDEVEELFARLRDSLDELPEIQRTRELLDEIPRESQEPSPTRYTDRTGLLLDGSGRRVDPE